MTRPQLFYGVNCLLESGTHSSRAWFQLTGKESEQAECVPDITWATAGKVPQYFNDGIDTLHGIVWAVKISNVFQRGGRWHVEPEDSTVGPMIVENEWAVLFQRLGVHLEVDKGYWMKPAIADARAGWITTDAKRAHFSPVVKEPVAESQPRAWPNLTQADVDRWVESLIEECRNKLKALAKKEQEERQNPGPELPRYNLSQQVRALYIKNVVRKSTMRKGSMTVEFLWHVIPNDSRFAEFPVSEEWMANFKARMQAPDMGYWVLYEDGHESWERRATLERVQ